MNPSQIKDFGSINHSENNNNDHSKEPSINNQFEGHEEYDCSEMGEGTPLLKQRYVSRSPSSISSLSSNIQESVLDMSNNNNLDSNFEINLYGETDSDNGTSNAFSSPIPQHQRQLKAQNDVCFPLIESAFKRGIGIDYEALEKYVKDENEKHQQEQRHQRRRLSESESVVVKKNAINERFNRCHNFKDNKYNSEILYRFTFYSTAHSTVHAHTLAEIPPLDLSLSEMLKNGCWWIDILSPTDDEMMEFGRIFGIHPLTIEDIETEETREKCEKFNDYYFICFRSFDQNHYSPTYLQPVNLYMIVMKEGILSFHFRPTPHPANVRRRIGQLKDYITVTPDWINYAIIDDVTDSFAPLIRSIEFEVDSIDELVLILKESEQTDMLRRIGHCRKKVLGLLRLLGSKADVMKALIKRCYELRWDVVIGNEIILYLGDIQDHIITMVQNLNHYEKILSRSHSNYLAQISIEMTQANNQINDILSRLTALGTILIPMNLVTGLWGMNVPVPGQESEGLRWFITILAGIILFSISGVIMAHRTGIV
ncbi:17440_t:CDS:2 [Entrophospora sp. SA101]|nr:7692_t:CDS:2 [Entrophospora sp. SA101]CAJ0845803.1 17440_t:CDS:2 [Entrophospora sp. SA101]CAJ0891177.1 12611_t:CDS:2 [Entrophospora sp. SA101]